MQSFVKLWIKITINMAKEVQVENEVVINVVTKVEQFLTEYKKVIWGSIAALVVLCAAGYCVYQFIYMPAKAEALHQMSKAEENFRNGNYELALGGDGNILGFEEIIAEYGSKAGKSVYLYAAICAMQTGDADKALEYAAKYSTSDQTLAGRAEAVKGDAYCNKGDYAKAAAAFEKAAKVSDNVFSAGYLVKAGEAYEAMGQNAKALAAYELVKDQYQNSIEAADIDKYIARIAVKEAE